jgi:hypothetical protein
MRSKCLLSLNKDIDAVIKIDLAVQQSPILKIKGYTEEEINNLVGQKFQEILDILGISDGNGV